MNLFSNKKTTLFHCLYMTSRWTPATTLDAEGKGLLSASLLEERTTIKPGLSSAVTIDTNKPLLRKCVRSIVVKSITRALHWLASTVDASDVWGMCDTEGHRGDADEITWPRT